MKRVLGFPTNANAEQQSVSVDCEEINSAKVVISTSSKSVISANVQASVIEGTNTPLGSSLNSKSVDFVCGVHAKNVLVWRVLEFRRPMMSSFHPPS